MLIDIARVQIRSATAAEVKIVVDWAAAEGWDPGLNDADCFFAADPDGFLVALLDDTLVGSISAVRYSTNFAFIGLYIVTPDLRGQGIGTKLWNAAMERCNNTTAGLDGVVAMQPAYASSGFVLAHNNIRHGGIPAPLTLDDHDLHTRPVTSRTDIEALDQECFGDVRPAFLEAWISQPNAKTIAAFERDQLRGYATLRRTPAGFKFGPVFAHDSTSARVLISELLADVPANAQVFLDTPETNPEAVAIARDLGLAAVFETARMYRGGSLQLPIEKIFGITSFELG
jgi:GNAT superfamily N-acetyltransferase